MTKTGSDGLQNTKAVAKPNGSQSAEHEAINSRVQPGSVHGSERGQGDRTTQQALINTSADLSGDDVTKQDALRGIVTAIVYLEIAHEFEMEDVEHLWRIYECIMTINEDRGSDAKGIQHITKNDVGNCHIHETNTLKEYKKTKGCRLRNDIDHTVKQELHQNGTNSVQINDVIRHCGQEEPINIEEEDTNISYNEEAGIVSVCEITMPANMYVEEPMNDLVAMFERQNNIPLEEPRYVESQPDILQVGSANSEDYLTDDSACTDKTKPQKKYKSIRYNKRQGQNYKCLDCGKGFQKNYIFEAHMRMHSGVLPFLCKICGKIYQFSASYHTHMLTHKNVSFQCHICGKLFNTKCNLCTHMRSHDDIKKYVCPTCGKRSSTSSNNIGHMKTHTNIKAHQCNICEKHFRRRSCMRKHQKKFHPGMHCV